MTSPTQSASSPRSPALEWLTARAPVTKDGQKAAAGAQDVDALLKLLLDGGHAADAVKVVAAALPPREAIWWAWAAATHAARLTGEEGTSPEALAALAATEKWIASPDDDARRAAWAAAERAGNDSAAGCAAAAPFFATGSIAPGNIAPIPPPPGMHTAMIGLAVILAAAADLPNFDALAGAYIAQGLEVVKQVGGWDRSIDLAKAHYDAQAEQQRAATTPPSAGPPADQPTRTN